MKYLLSKNLLEWFEMELKRRGIQLTEEDLREFIKSLEEKEWISLNPQLYRELMEDAAKVLENEIKQASEDLSKVEKEFREYIKVEEVKFQENLKPLVAIGSDASRCLMPILISRAALISGIALRYPHETKPSILKEAISIPPSEMSYSVFRFYVSAKCESLIPLSVQHQLLKYGASEVVVIDGPLSLSQWYREVPSKVEKAVNAINELLDARGNLMKICHEMNIPVIGVVKRSRSRYFHNYLGLANKSHYSDQYIFHQMLNYAQRTGSISITQAIIKWRSGVKAKDLLITKLPYEIYGFYIKTSRNPLTPPVRVEYPEYLRDMEDWIASYVLSTAVQTYDPEFDGLPVIQCLAHKNAKITSKIMWEIYKERLYEISRKGGDLRLLVPMKGYSPK